MPAVGALSPVRHLVVGAAAAAVGLASYTGVIGEERSERFEAKQIVFSPSGSTGVRAREVVDIDFGDERRHGYERLIPNDFGVPTEVTADSPTAPDDLSVDSFGGDTRIRVGDPDVTLTGQHRYVLQYTYPNTTVSSGTIALDVIGDEETLVTEHFEVVVTGFELTDRRCNVGGAGASGGCELVDDGEVYRAVIAPLEPGDGITIGGTITGTRPTIDVQPPPRPEENPNRRAPLALATTTLGLATGSGVYLWARRRGRNEVFSGGAADAAYGVTGPTTPRPGSGLPLPAPSAVPTAGGSAGVRLVADADLGELATIEFVPPAGVEPWLGNVLLGEKITDETVSAWISGAAAREYLTISKDDDGAVVIAAGPGLADAPPEDQEILSMMLGGRESIVLGRYSRSFAKAWAAIKQRQQATVARSGYWKRPIAGLSGVGATSGIILLYALVIGGLFAFRGAGRALGLLDHPAAAIATAAVLPAVVALVVYNTLLPARTAEGSALTLRTESFRRFLAASEGRHVEWAWTHGRLREYSAWAVALGEATTWQRAMEQSSVPPAELISGPMIVYSSAGLFSRSHTAPSSSGSSSGRGGFSGGSVGGGGGGGSSGSW